MQSANITNKDNCALISGILDFTTIAGLRLAGEKLLAEQDNLEFDFTDVSRSDSTGLVLLIAWFRSAQKNKKTIRFIHLPKQLFDIAKVSGLEKILPIC